MKVMAAPLAACREPSGPLSSDEPVDTGFSGCTA